MIKERFTVILYDACVSDSKFEGKRIIKDSEEITLAEFESKARKYIKRKSEEFLH